MKTVEKKNILVLTYWNLADALIQTYTLPYVRIMQQQPAVGHIHLLTLEKERPTQGRQQYQGHLANDGITWLPARYHRFGLRALVAWALLLPQLLYYIHRHRIHILHCWCTPAGAMGWVLSVLSGRPLVLDSYEPHAEAMVENGTWKPGSLPHRLLFWFEKKQTQRAQAIIGVTGSMRGYALARYGVHVQNFFVKPACTDLEVFSLTKRKNEKLLQDLQLTNKRVAVYAGKFGGIYLDREVFEFLACAYQRWGDSFRVLLLTPHTLNEIQKWAEDAGLPLRTVVIRFVPHTEIAQYIGLADFALCPVKPVYSKRHCTPIKNGEYWAMGLPVVIPAHISDDADLIAARRAGIVLYELNSTAYCVALGQLEQLCKDTSLTTRIRKLAEQQRSFSIAAAVYEQVYR